MRTTRPTHGCALATFGWLTALAAGCGGDGGGPAAFRFSATTATQGVGVTKAALGIVPRVTALTLKIFDQLVAGEVGALDLCAAGRADLRWDDADQGGTPSTGDAVTLTLTDCAVAGGAALSGTAAFDLVTVSGHGATLDVSLALTIVGAAGPETLAGAFTLYVTSADLVRFTFRFSGPHPDGFLRAERGGETLYRLGCFDLVAAFSRARPEVVTLVAAGDLDTGASGVIGLFPYGGPALTFRAGPGGIYPEAGQLELLGAAVCAPCAGAGVPAGGLTPAGARVRLVATGGGAVTLYGTDASGAALFELPTTWAALE